MLRSVKTYVSERQRCLTKAGAFIASAFYVRGYIRDRLAEVKDRLEQERAARDSLKCRFDQTQDDVAFTVLALIETLAEQITREMDVEGLTRELRNRSEARNRRRSSERPSSSLGSSVDGDGDGAVEDSSVVVVMEESSVMIASSWVESSSTSGRSTVDSEGADAGSAEMNTSIVTVSSVQGGRSVSVAASDPSNGGLSSSVSSDMSDARTTAELWNDVKILTLTRTLTTLYSTTLLSLLTTIQLTLLARSKYIQSVLQLERDERLQQHIEAQFSLSNLLLQSGKGLETLLSGDMEALLDDDEGPAIPSLTEDVETRFLTMSWWILHVGWKDVGERVRRSVEEVFSGIPLKTKLAPIDLHRLVSGVRRRVEYEVTFEGNERRVNFLSSLLPPTPETVQHVLTQGGFPSPLHSFPAVPTPHALSAASSSRHLTLPPPSSPRPRSLSQNTTQDSKTYADALTQDPNFTALLNETRSVISSADFTRVLEVCLDSATGVLFDALERDVFVSPDVAPGEAVRIRLAGLLPGLARWSREAVESVPCVLVDNVLATREVECLSAIVFAKFEEYVAW
ncbi:Peroxisomal biogenesis factor 3 [Hypsizygus marmoreus]|uniref:Peroxisomal biogenesis factor 3 n=1 Tax=Hypsizygus marmoreus TaxID=39966 RepID=A0A369J476_HYPMA|nr:Peroxisomal biogenesis factor 3 [Hypsizygus marmoreus]